MLPPLRRGRPGRTVAELPRQISVRLPDASRIAFETDRDGSLDIYTVAADGSDLTRVTDHAADDRAPDWSPDGERILFSTRRDGNLELYTITPEGSDPVRLTDHGAGDFNGTFGPERR